MADVQRHADAAGQGDAAFETASFLFTVLDDDYEAAHKGPPRCFG